MKPWLFALLATVLLTGCPDPKSPPKEGGGATDEGGKDPKAGGDSDDPNAGKSTDPLEGSVFDKETLFEIYEGDQAGGAERLAVFKKHRLADAQGTLVPIRVAAYERALKRYASGDPEGWSVFLESLAK